MASYHLRSKAEEDLLNIWKYIAENSPASATKLIRAFHQHFALLAENPQLGRARSDIRAGLRSFPVKRYLLLYRSLSDEIEVVRVIHGSRDMGALFEPGDAE